MSYKYSPREIKIAEWLGFEWFVPKSRRREDPFWKSPSGEERFPHTPGDIPHFDTDLGAAASLLPELARRGWNVRIKGAPVGDWEITCFRDDEWYAIPGNDLTLTISTLVEGIIDSEYGRVKMQKAIDLIEDKESSWTKKYCKWNRWQIDDFNTWQTSCGQAQCFIEGDISDNQYKFCPYCGKPIREHK